MNKTIYDLLNSINNCGYQAYIVGGYVRDYVLSFDENKDLDIVTDAPLNILLDIFKAYNPQKFKNETLKFKYYEYNVDVAQIREESYKDGKIIVSFTSDLKKDYLRRDFTINSLYMDKNNKIYDFSTGIEDCKNLSLKFVSDGTTKCIEDPTRILRAIYFILKYNLKEYHELFNINVDLIDFNKADINALNKCMYKILKLGLNDDFVKILEKFNIYNLLFAKKSNSTFLKPTDFLIENKYLFLK